jgi:hypothetical protein
MTGSVRHQCGWVRSESGVDAAGTSTTDSAVVVKLYMGYANNFTTFFSEADIFDDPFLGREPTYHTNSLAQILIHFLAFTLSQVRGSLVVLIALYL